MSAYAVSARGLVSRRIPQGVLAPMNALLFGSGQQGAWYDPSDISTLFQDSAGTTPVTAVEQPVGLMLDKSGRGNNTFQATSTKRPVYSRRVNLLTGSESFTTGWATFGTPTYMQNAAIAPDGTTSAVRVSGCSGSEFRYFPVSVSGGYRISIWAKGEVGGELLVLQSAPSGINVVHTLTTAWARYTFDYTGSWSRVDITLSAVSQVAYLWGADFRPISDSHLPYQRVNTATDYDADPAKFPAYLKFDGVDDAMQTANIDFTGTDKMTVWAGVTKLSDAAPSVLLELSVNSYLNLGTIGLFTPTTVNGNDISQRSIGTSDRVLTVGGFTSPMSFVVTGYMGITPPIIGLRIAGSVIGTTSASQGTGNYGNYPLYIGARAGTSLFLNGKIYSLIVRGAESSLSQIEATELYMKQKMRLP